MKNRKCLSPLMLFFLAHLSFTAMATAQERVLSFPITSDQLSEYIAKYEDIFGFYIRPEYEKQKLKFNSQEIEKSPQGRNEWGETIDTTAEYFEMGRFHLDGFLYKLIAYELDAINTFTVFNIQLNSYDKNGTLTDALLLDNRYAFEDVEAFSSFSISQNEAFIYYYITRILTVDEGGNFNGVVENPIPKLYGYARYKIDNGHFSLIDKTDNIKDGSK